VLEVSEKVWEPVSISPFSLDNNKTA